MNTKNTVPDYPLVECFSPKEKRMVGGPMRHQCLAKRLALRVWNNTTYFIIALGVLVNIELTILRILIR